MTRISMRMLLGIGLLLALLLAAGVSFYASESPDGLNRVAEDKGFAKTEDKHAADGSPLAGYDASGVPDARLSRAVAGAAGCAVVLVLTGTIAVVTRRRPEPRAESSDG